jgi:type IV secretory pathway TraG/TraD family ATPase VirD4
VSAWLGQTTVPAISRTVGAGGVRATVHPYVRPLALPDDIARIPDGTVLALAGARRPFALSQARYFDPPARTLLPAVAAPPFSLRARPAAPVLPEASGDGAGALRDTGVGSRPLRPRQAAPRPHGGVSAPQGPGSAARSV